MFWGLSSIDMALLAELHLATIGRNQGFLDQGGYQQVYDAAEKENRRLSGWRKSLGVA